MIQKYSKSLPAAFIPAAVIAAFISGMLLKMSVDLCMGDASVNSYSYLGMNRMRAVVFVIYLMLFSTAAIVLLIRCRWKSAVEHSRSNMINEKQRRQRTEVVSAVGKLQDAYMEAEQHYVAKSRFLHRMSHDLRTPMNAIIGYSMLLERTAGDAEKVNHYARRIFMAGQSLLELINDTLDMSCIESGRVKLVESEYSLLSALEEIKSSVKPQAESKNQNFRYYLMNNTGTDRIIGDKQRLCQIMRNILSNAVKYTPESGDLDMIVNIMEVAGGQPQMMCQIKDTGCGMSREFMQRLFIPFEREDNELNTGAEGSGLGMCIAKSFTELMNGKISVESESGKGTLVTVIIPLKPVGENDREIRHDFTAGGTLRGLRFLAAEDNESNAEILNEVLTAMGAECTIAEHGQAALDIFENSAPGQYDIILMDIQMPVMNGYQAASAIRQSKHPDAKSIKIVAMTADAFEEDVQKAFVSGMNAHAAKPLNLEAFTNTVASFDLKRNDNRTGCVDLE